MKIKVVLCKDYSQLTINLYFWATYGLVMFWKKHIIEEQIKDIKDKLIN